MNTLRSRDTYKGRRQKFSETQKIQSSSAPGAIATIRGVREKCLALQIEASEKFWSIMGFAVMRQKIVSSLKIENIYDFFRDLASVTTQIVSPNVSKSAASTVDALDLPCTECEIKVVMKKLAGLKSPGNFPVATEVLKMLSSNETFRTLFTNALFYVFTCSKIAFKWPRGELVPATKPDKPQAVRPITVLPFRHESFRPFWHKGWKPGRFLAMTKQFPAIIAVFLTRFSSMVSLYEKALLDKRKMYLAFMGYSSAFDTVCHDKLWNFLLQKGVSMKALRFLKTQYEGANNVVNWQGAISDPYMLQKGVR